MEEPSRRDIQAKADETQKMVGLVTRIASVTFMVIGAVVMATGGDMILGGILFIIGLVDLVLLPRVLEKVMMEKLKQRQNRDRVE